jgi:HEAT repeat protein
MIALVREALAHGRETVRERATRLLPGLLPPPAFVAELLTALTDPSWRVRRAAVCCLAEQPVHAAPAIHQILALLHDPNAVVRQAAAEAIEVIAAAGSLPDALGTVTTESLIVLLRDVDEMTRAAAVCALGQMGKPTAVLPALCERLRDESEDVRRCAAEAIRRIGPAAAGAEADLLGVLHDPDCQVRLAAVTALGCVAGGSAIPALLRAADHADDRAGTGAAALASITRREPDAERLLQSALRGSSPRQRVAAARALAMLESSQAVQYLREQLTDRKPRRRCRALRLLGWFTNAPAEVLPDLQRALNDSQERVRAAATRTVGAWGSSAAFAIGALIRRRHDRSRRVRAAAVAALAALLPRLPELLRGWLAILTDPGHPAAFNLRQVLARTDLPDAVRQEFIAACARRGNWHRQHAGLEVEAEHVAASPWEAARTAARHAARKATRHVAGDKVRIVARNARAAEHAWQLAYLGTLLAGAR